MEEQKKKVLIGITKATWGGAPRYVYELVSTLPRASFVVSVVAGTEGVLAAKLRESDVPLHSIAGMQRDIKWLGELGVFFRTLAVIKRERPHILHLNSAKMAGMGAVAGRILGIPKIVVTVHGWTFREDRPRPVQAIIWALQWLTALLTHETIVITKIDYEMACRMPFLPKKKIQLIPIGANPDHYQFLSTEEARKRLRVILAARFPGRDLSALGNPLWVGANGELHFNKDYPTLLKAMTKLPTDVPLVVMSSGVEEGRLHQLAEDLGISERVFFAGFVKDAANYIPAFSIFAMTSTKEGLPYVILEAGLASLPVVATRAGAIPDVITNGVSGLLVDLKDVAAVADRIRSLLSDHELRIRLGTQLHENVMKNFSARKMVEKTIICYQ